MRFQIPTTEYDISELAIACQTAVLTTNMLLGIEIHLLPNGKFKITNETKPSGIKFLDAEQILYHAIRTTVAPKVDDEIDYNHYGRLLLERIAKRFIENQND
jgi:hypothetical protein